MSLEGFDTLAAEARAELELRHAAREEVLKISRLLIQTCSKAIKHIHRRQMEEARSLLGEAKLLSQRMRQSASQHPEILYAGYIQDSEKEMVEGYALLAMVEGRPFESAAELGVGVNSWLHGMGEAASEARRWALDDMRNGGLLEAEKMLEIMDGIYDELTTFDFPDGLTGGLRRTCDALRAVIERTRSDLTMTQVQNKLIERLDKSLKEKDIFL